MGKLLEKWPVIERPTPIVDALKSRPTIILGEPIIKKLNPIGLNPELPAGVTREEAIQVIAGSTWAQNLATGWLKAFMPTLTPGTLEYEEAHKRIARRVAEGVLR